MSAPRPNFVTMKTWYEGYRNDTHPCKADVANQSLKSLRLDTLRVYPVNFRLVLCEKFSNLRNIKSGDLR